MTGAIQVFTTVDSQAAARAIARAVVERRAAACAQIVGPIESTYWWSGEIETAQEWLCILKSTERLYPSLEAAIRQSHPYDTPEILAMPVSAGLSAYLDWLRAETRD
jgi:periplasmic divalent cation tolerance protein